MGSILYMVLAQMFIRCTDLMIVIVRAAQQQNLYSIPGLTNMCIYDASSIRSENRTNYGETYDKRGTIR